MPRTFQPNTYKTASDQDSDDETTKQLEPEIVHVVHIDFEDMGLIEADGDDMAVEDLAGALVYKLTMNSALVWIVGDGLAKVL